MGIFFDFFLVVFVVQIFGQFLGKYCIVFGCFYDFFLELIEGMVVFFVDQWYMNFEDIE